MSFHVGSLYRCRRWAIFGYAIGYQALVSCVCFCMFDFYVSVQPPLFLKCVVKECICESFFNKLQFIVESRFGLGSIRHWSNWKNHQALVIHLLMRNRQNLRRRISLVWICFVFHFCWLAYAFAWNKREREWIISGRAIECTALHYADTYRHKAHSPAHHRHIHTHATYTQSVDNTSA